MPSIPSTKHSAMMARFSKERKERRLGKKIDMSKDEKREEKNEQKLNSS